MIAKIFPKENEERVDSVDSALNVESNHKSNAFLIRPAKGALKGIKAIKSNLKAEGCHWHSAANTWSCPYDSKEKVCELLKTKNLTATIVPFSDQYFEKSETQKEAEDLWARIDFLERDHQAETMRLIGENAALDKEIKDRALNEDDPGVLEKRILLRERDQKQAELAVEIGQLRNSAKLLEESKAEEISLPFHILGYNSQHQILIWQNGRLLALASTHLNRNELRLLVGGQSKWFQMPDGDQLLKNRLIDEARERGFIDDQAPLKAGVWNLKGKWIIISGKQAAIIENAELRYLEEPIFEGRLIETNVASWIDWDAFEESLKSGPEAIKNIFNRLYEKVKLWNWSDPSMAAYATAFIMLSIVQQAMKWRPWIYLTGAKSTGKSTFFEFLLQTIFGVLVERLDKSTAHATAQTVGNSGRIPVFDEFEKHRHIPEILELAKLFNKGGQKTSGTGAEKAHRYLLHHMPWFGSIYLPKNLIQDAAQESRIVKLELKKLKGGTPLLEKFDTDEAPKIAAEIVAAMIVSWEKIEKKAQEINADRNLLIQKLPGIEIRTIENFMYASSLLILAAPELADPLIPAWAAMQSEDDGEKLLDAMLASIVRFEGETRSISELLQLSKASPDERYTKELERYGLRFTTHKALQFLAIRCENVNRHLLKDTDYAALDIKGPLSRVEGAVGSAQVKMAGANQRCVLIPTERLGGLL
jgi:hypothetical protein